MGKTTIALQLVVSVDQGIDWLSLAVDEPGPAMFLSAEEDEEEIHRRLADILEHTNIAFRGLKGVHLLGMPGQDVTLGAPDRNGDIIRPTELFHRLAEAVCDIRPKLLVIEAAADVFAGNENNRSQVRQFIGLLRRLAGKEAGTAVVLLQHPSLTGISTGTGNSGSTQWSNSVRSRLYFSKVKSNGSDEPDLRQLEVMKANYGPSGEVVKVRWQRGVFLPEAGTSMSQRGAADCFADDVFLHCLETKKSQGIEVVATTGRGYAPSVFVAMPEAKGLSRKTLADAMERLLSGNRIRQVMIGGPPSRPKHGLVRCA